MRLATNGKCETCIDGIFSVNVCYETSMSCGLLNVKVLPSLVTWPVVPQK